MFLAELNDTEKQAFVELVKRFMMADGRRGEAENDMLEKMKLEMWPRDLIGQEGLRAQCLRMEAANNGITLDGNSPSTAYAAFFKSQASRAIALLELIGLGHADTSYCALEEEFINEMADAFGVSQAEIAVMENWVIRQLALVSEAQAIINGETE